MSDKLGRRSALALGVLSAGALLAGLGTARGQSSGGIKLTVLYTAQKDPAKFTKYYLGTHMPLVGKVAGIQRTEVAVVQEAPPGQPAPPYYRITELYWDSVAAMQKSMDTAEWKVIVDDVQNFADPNTLSAFTSLVGA